MPNIFISYRRHDSPANARLLYERLQEGFPDDDVFMDVEEIGLGDNWRDALREHVAAADFVLVVVGRRWFDERDANGNRRLEDENDLVRWEIAEAIRSGKKVIPVLVDEAGLPAAAELPADIATLPDFQAQVLSHLNFSDDIQTLLARLSGRRHGDDLIKRLQQQIRMGKAGLLVAAGIGSLAVALAWANLFDLLGLDTRSAGFTMLIGDVLDEPRISNDLVLVAIQPADHEQTRLRTDRRRQYAALITKAAGEGARRVVFDLTLERQSEHDSILGEAIRQARAQGMQVVFGFNRLEDGLPALSSPIRQAGALAGFTCVGERLGNVTYGGLAMQLKGSDETLRSLALEAAHAPNRTGPLSSDHTRLDFDTDGTRGQTIDYSLLETVDRPDADCTARAPGTKLARLIVRISHKERWRDPIRRITLTQALSDGPNTPSLFRERIILVGAEHPADLLKTRLDGIPNRYGFEFHADTINALLTEQIIQPLPFVWQWLISGLLIVAATGWRLLRLGKPRRLDAIALPLLCAMLMAGAVLLYVGPGLLVDSLYHLAALLLTWWILVKLERRWCHAKS